MRRLLRARVVSVVMWLQDRPVYRRVAPRLFGPFETREATPEEAEFVRSRPSAVGHAQEGLYSRVTLFVSVRKGRVAGWHYLQRNSPESPMSGYILVGLYVRLPYRGLGLGRVLMQVPTDRARDEGADEVLFVVSALNARAIGLYRRMGFEVTPDHWPEWQQRVRERHGGVQIVMRLGL